jgi:hypothetical protein
MAQPSDFRNRGDRAGIWRLDWPSVGPILVEGQDSSQVSFAEDEHVVQTLAPDRANEPFREGILPRALWGGDDFLDTHAVTAAPKLFTGDGVTIP